MYSRHENKEKDSLITTLFAEIEKLVANVERLEKLQTKTQRLVKSLNVPEPPQPSLTPMHQAYEGSALAQPAKAPIQSTDTSAMLSNVPEETTPAQTARASAQASNTLASALAQPDSAHGTLTNAHEQTAGALMGSAPAQLSCTPAQSAITPAQSDSAHAMPTRAPTINGAININGVSKMDHIYIGNVLPTHTTEQIKDFIHLRAKIDKSHIKIQELSQNQREPRSKAFKASVPKGKLQACIKLPWDSTIKVQPFRAKPFGSATGPARKQANEPFQPKTAANND